MIKNLLNRAIKPVCVFLAFVLVLSIYIAVVAKINKSSEIKDGNYIVADKAVNTAEDGYKLACEDNKTLLYVNYKNGGFYVESKADNSKWYSSPVNADQDNISKGVTKMETQSDLIVEYISVNDENSNSVIQTANSTVGCLQGGTVTVENIKNGFRVTYDFKNLEIKIPVEYVLENGALNASVLTDKIEDGTKNYLVTVKLLPYFGAAGSGEKGYLFIPDGSGAVSKFNNGAGTNSYEKEVFGTDKTCDDNTSSSEKNVLAPVFGTVVESNKSALMGIISSGEGGASIAAKTGNSKTYFNNIYSEMHYRVYSVGKSFYVNNKTNDISILTHVPFGKEKYTVRYYILSGDDADYSGMAKKYREYLTDDKNLKKQAEEPYLAMDVYGALATKQYTLGISYNKLRVLTDFKTAEEIVSSLNKSGIDKMSVRYIGWCNNGVFNSKITENAAPLKVLGGKNDMLKLIDYAEKNNSNVYPEADLITFVKNGNGVTKTKSGAKAISGDAALQSEYSIVTNDESAKRNKWFLIKPSLFGNVFDSFMNKYNKLGVKTLALSEIGESIYSDFSKTNGTYKAKSIDYAEALLKSASTKADRVAVSGGNAYAFPYVTNIFDLPVSSSGYELFDYDVPFIQMALHGYVSYSSEYIQQTPDKASALLKAIEYGSNICYSCIGDETYKLSETPLSNIFSSEFSLWKDEAVKYYKDYKKTADLVWEAEIDKHERIADNVFKVVYSNGVCIYVNYNNAAVNVEGTDIQALSYNIGNH